MPDRDRPAAYEPVLNDIGVRALLSAPRDERGERIDSMLRRLETILAPYGDEPVHLVLEAAGVATPLHELVDLCREQGLALDLSIYSNDDGALSTYIGGARVTGHIGDPMDVIRAGVRARRHAAKGAHDAD